MGIFWFPRRRARASTLASWLTLLGLPVTSSQSLPATLYTLVEPSPVCDMDNLADFGEVGCLEAFRVPAEEIVVA